MSSQTGRKLWSVQEDQALRKSIRLYNPDVEFGKFQITWNEGELREFHKVILHNLATYQGNPDEFWAASEHLVARFQRPVENGPKRWTAIAMHVRGRNGKQCRERFYNRICDGIRRVAFSELEDSILRIVVEHWGQQWSMLARLLPGRTANAIKNRQHLLARRLHSSQSGKTKSPKALKPSLSKRKVPKTPTLSAALSVPPTPVRAIACDNTPGHSRSSSVDSSYLSDSDQSASVSPSCGPSFSRGFVIPGFTTAPLASTSSFPHVNTNGVYPYVQSALGLSSSSNDNGGAWPTVLQHQYSQQQVAMYAAHQRSMQARIAAATATSAQQRMTLPFVAHAASVVDGYASQQQQQQQQLFALQQLQQQQQLQLQQQVRSVDARSPLSKKEHIVRTTASPRKLAVVKEEEDNSTETLDQQETEATHISNSSLLDLLSIAQGMN